MLAGALKEVDVTSRIGAAPMPQAASACRAGVGCGDRLHRGGVDPAGGIAMGIEGISRSQFSEICKDSKS